MVCPVFRKARPLYVKHNGERSLYGVNYGDGSPDGLRIIKKPFLCSDGITRQTVWIRRLGRCFVEWNDKGQAVIRAAESGLDGSVYSPSCARKYV